MIGRVLLVGLGVVGRAIAMAHLRAGIPVDVLDAQPDAIDRWEASLGASSLASQWRAEPIESCLDGLSAARMMPVRQTNRRIVNTDLPPLLIESISEQLALKQDFFAAAKRALPEDTILCSNTSTLPIKSITAKLGKTDRIVGFHFFMPVECRSAVEIIASPRADVEVIGFVENHARSLGKQPIRVGDGVGFVVNRLLAPYINESITLLCSGASEKQIGEAARAFGMPLSPLELVDLIGIRTAFDGGRSYWQAFPQRMTTAPLLPALLKKHRFGTHAGGGFFDYDVAVNSECLADETKDLVRRYTRDERRWTVDQIHHRLAVTMWTEAACILRDGIVSEISQIDLAMSGGLGYGTSPGQDPREFSDHMARLGMGIIRSQWRGDNPVQAPEWLQAAVAGEPGSSEDSPKPSQFLAWVCAAKDQSD